MMKRIVMMLMALTIVAHISAPAAMAEGAVVIAQEGSDCVMPGADVNGNLIFGGIGEVVIILMNNNKLILKCSGTGITNDSGRGQHFDDFPCVIQFGGVTYPADDMQATISANGVASMTCTVNL